MNPQNTVIPVPYKGQKYEIHIKYVIRPQVGYHVSIYKNGKFAGELKNVLGTTEDCKREGSKLIVGDYMQKSAADAHGSANLATASETSPYASGTIKLSWVDDNDRRILHHQMYDNIEEALKNTYEKKNWLIFKLKQSAGDGYDWELMPYGRSKTYTRSLFLSDNPIIKFLIFGLSVTGAYFIGKAIYDKLKENSVPSLSPTIAPTTVPVISNVAKV